MILKCQEISAAHKWYSQLVVGCRESKVRRAALRNPEMDIDNILEMALTCEQREKEGHGAVGSSPRKKAKTIAQPAKKNR